MCYSGLRTPNRHVEAAINLRQLRYFVKVVEVGNITRAAELLNVAQPALGLQIRQLEQDLSVDLLVRHSRGIAPTAAGRLLFERASGILEQVEHTKNEVRTLGEVAQETFTLGLSPSIMMQFGPELLISGPGEMPGVFLSLVEELSFVLGEALERGELDAAFAYEVPERPGIDRRAILREELLFVTAPGAAPQSSTIRFADALSGDLVQAGGRDMVRKLVEHEAQKLSLPVRVPFEASSISAMKAMVTRGIAASIMPFGTAAEELRAGLLVSRRIEDPHILRTLYLIRPTRRKPSKNEAAIDRFLDGIQARLLEALGELSRPIEP